MATILAILFAARTIVSSCHTAELHDGCNQALALIDRMMSVIEMFHQLGLPTRYTNPLHGESMRESSVSAPPKFSWSLWARIAYACFMFAVGGLCLWSEFMRFEWVLFLCMGLFGLVYVPLQKGEIPRIYVSKPRTIISLALPIAAGVVALHMLYDKFMK